MTNKPIIYFVTIDIYIVCDNFKKFFLINFFFFQSLNDPRSSLRRTFKYLLPVAIISIGINLPKFFEAEIKTHKDQNGTEIVELAVTELRKNPDYTIYYSNWTRLLGIGCLPFVMLIWFNLKIYQDIKVIS